MAKSTRVESKDTEGNDIVLVVKKPTQKELTKAQIYSSKMFKQACDAGMCFRSKLEEYLIEEGEWSDELRVRANLLENELFKDINCLMKAKKSDGTKMKLSEGRELAILIKRKRLELIILRTKLREHDAFTIEGYVENARFDYLVHLCTFDKEGVLLFETIDDYLEKSEEPYANAAATALSKLMYQTDEDWEKKLPENEFLLKHKFINDEMRYIGKDGGFVDASGRKINEKGELVNDTGELIDELGNLVPKEEENAEFIDDVFDAPKPETTVEPAVESTEAVVTVETVTTT